MLTDYNFGQIIGLKQASVTVFYNHAAIDPNLRDVSLWKSLSGREIILKIVKM